MTLLRYKIKILNNENEKEKYFNNIINLLEKLYNSTIKFKNNKEIKFNKQKYINYLKKFNNNIYIVETIPNNEIIGFALGFRYNINKTYYHISKIYIIKKYRNKKIGQNLLKFIIRQAKLYNCNYIDLNVYNQNEIALYIYLKNKFKIYKINLCKKI